MVYGPVFCCASTAKVNDIGEKVLQNIDEVQIAMPIFMNDFSSTKNDSLNIDREIVSYVLLLWCIVHFDSKNLLKIA